MCDLVTTKFGALTRVVIVEELLPSKFTDSFGLLMLAVLVTLGAAAAAMVTGKITVATLLFAAAIATVLVQLTTLPPAAPVQVQLAPMVQPAPPEAVVKVRPVGKVSVTVIVPVVATPPMLLVVSV